MQSCGRHCQVRREEKNNLTWILSGYFSSLTCFHSTAVAILYTPSTPLPLVQDSLWSNRETLKAKAALSCPIFSHLSLPSCYYSHLIGLGKGSIPLPCPFILSVLTCLRDLET